MENPFEQIDNRLGAIEIALNQIQQLLGLAKIVETKEQLAEKSIRVLQLPVLSFNVLRDRLKIYSIKELCEHSKEELKNARGLGPSGLRSIEEALARIGMKLSED